MDVFTNASVVVQEKLSFSAFGERRKSAGWQGNFGSAELVSITDITKRGFTDHYKTEGTKRGEILVLEIRCIRNAQKEWMHGKIGTQRQMEVIH